MKVAVVGKNGFGGREYIISHTIMRQDPETELFLFPGNGGTAELGLEIQLPTMESIIEKCTQLEVDYIIGGPEADFDEGLADLAQMKNIPVFGPSREAARIETNKLFTKKILEIFDVPTAPYRYFPFSQLSEVTDYLTDRGLPAVIKANGLAAGKGVLVLDKESGDLKQAETFCKELAGGQFGGAGKTGALVEDFLNGEEASLFFLVNTKENILVPMRSARDHKRAWDGDLGPNTGGMGAYSENPILDERKILEVQETIARPVLEGLKALGISYCGVLYLGLMITSVSIYVIEINCRFGDPEIQVLAPRLKSSLRDTLYAIAKGDSPGGLEWSDEHCVGVVLASKGYPDSYPRGLEIEGLETIPEDLILIHAGTKRHGQGILSSGGRVLNLCAMDRDLSVARSKVYSFLDKKTLHFDGMQFRSDIAIQRI